MDSRNRVALRATDAHGHPLGERRDGSGAPWTGHAEHFLTDPGVHPDPSTWVTELVYKTI
ncbi:hypothetical protein [Dietzia sp. DQ12-45-1b]|uniref:hypothetical protein n=1 Tax=Dietzia sp. DQ12-45-1b TaxID=912801 RepID=UPI0013187615|nr:hypothetical protein [Dietzia sp. DQ12-45-1b]QGW24067.1 transcriptional regulator [Dietzia sp. DQ12-45-1b]